MSVTGNGGAAKGDESRNTMLKEEFALALIAQEERLRDPAYRQWRERIEEGIGGRVKTDEERLEQHVARLMYDAVFRCPRCGREIETGDVLHRRRVPDDSDTAFGSSGWTLESYCGQCVAGWHPSWLAQRREPFPCAGACGALVSYWGYENITTCSRRCSEIAARERRRVRHTERSCGVCGETFTPKRSDARYCSSACRQDAYRQRRAGRL